MINAKELLKRIPKNYRELNYKTYLNLITTVMVENESGMDDEEFKYFQSISTLSILLGVTYAELEQLPFYDIKPLLDSLSFMNHDIPVAYTNLKVKEIEKLTYNEFQYLIKALPNQFENLPDILETVLVEMTKEDIDKLSISEVMQVIKKLNLYYRKFISRSQKSLALHYLKMRMKEKLKKVIKIG